MGGGGGIGGVWGEAVLGETVLHWGRWHWGGIGGVLGRVLGDDCNEVAGI